MSSAGRSPKSRHASRHERAIQAGPARPCSRVVSAGPRAHALLHPRQERGDRARLRRVRQSRALGVRQGRRSEDALSRALSAIRRLGTRRAAERYDRRRNLRTLAGGDVSDRHPHHPEHHRPSTYHEKLTAAVLELLAEKNILSPAQITESIAVMDARGPHLGAKVVARAWTDAAFKQRLLADGSAACREMGIDVCTLCSCYPKMLLGIPPAWYKSKAYRSRTAREPRKVLAEFGLDVPGDVTVRVHDSTADMRYLVLPLRPRGTDGWTAAQLEQLVTRDAMIGVARAKEPAAV